MDGKFTGTGVTDSMFIFGTLSLEETTETNKFILTIVYKGTYRKDEVQKIDVSIHKNTLYGEGVKMTCLEQSEDKCGGHFNFFGHTGDFVLNLRKEIQVPIVEKNNNDKRVHYYCTIV